MRRKHIFGLVLLPAFAVLLLNKCHRTGKINEDQGFLRISEITLERIWDNCIGCANYQVTLSKDGPDPYKDVSITYTETKTERSGGLQTQSTVQRKGKLESFYFHRLAILLESQGYFKLKDHYGAGIIDTLIVKTSVVRDGNRRAVLNNAHEGPIELWGIEMAIDGAIARVTWEPEDSKQLQP
jgi:hypothetical protein